MKEFLEEIQTSFRILTLEHDWDGDGAKPISRKAYCRALEFLFKLVNTVGVIETPEINHVSNGSVDISFRSETIVGKNRVRLLINVKDDSIAWYGDVDNDHEVQNKQGDELYNEDLFNWIKTYLKK